MEVVILGTSSAAPTLRRWLSATVILREGEVFLFDCGEGTQFRFMKADLPRRKFRHVFITHLHGDHIFGLGGFISTMNLGGRDIPLEIFGPRGIKRFVDFMTTFPRPTRLGFELKVTELAPGYAGPVTEGEDWEVSCAPLDHTIPAFGYRFQEKDRPGRFDGEKADALGVPFGPERGRLQRGESVTTPEGRVVTPEELVGPPRKGKSVAYVTDTGFAIAARKLARDVDLLIHEATYGDDALDMALDRKHSTIRHAATIAKGANAKRFVATHFSTRYDGPALAQLEAEGREVFPDLVMAHDLLRLEV
ncbi:MAG TPA: ribonuclease Z [Planctomycetota bacterium]|nr:ribonuclease Z [Planctomycetota bacterium]